MSETIDELADRREEMDVTLSDLGDRLAECECYDVAGSTLSSRASEWERGEREFAPKDVENYQDVLEAIHAERNPDYPDCPGCGRSPVFEPEEIDGVLHCLVCVETSERDRKRETMARLRRVLDDVETESEPVDEHRPLTAFQGGESA